MKKLFIVVNGDWFFLSHRKEIAIAAQKAGFEVTIVAKNTGKMGEIESLGLKFIELPMDRIGMNILREVKTFLFILLLYRTKRPSIVHHVGLKVVLIAGLAAKLAKINGVVNAISGLGVSFSKEHINSFTTIMILQMLRYSHRRNMLSVIFQNEEDRSIFIKKKIICKWQSKMIKGSGIDLEQFNYTPEPSTGKIKVMFAARMLIEKGILDLVQAANLLKADYGSKVQFILCGGIDVNPNALSEDDLHQICDDNYIVWLGHRIDVKDLLKTSHIVAFPSYYKEGLPKSLIEAAAIGRPIITTNSIGCKDVVEDGINGFLIPIKDSIALAKRLKLLIDNRDLRIEFGKKSRILAERDYSIWDVIDAHLSIYSEFVR